MTTSIARKNCMKKRTKSVLVYLAQFNVLQSITDTQTDKVSFMNTLGASHLKQIFTF